MGHLEKKCQIRFRDDFVDPEKAFPYGEWLKVPAPGSSILESRAVSYTKLSNNSRGAQSTNQQGVHIIEFGQQRTFGTHSSRCSGDKENIPGVSQRQLSFTERGVSNNRKGKETARTERSLIKPSQTKNRKKKTVEMDAMEDDRPLKRQILGDLTDLVPIMVEAVPQPHREL